MTVVACCALRRMVVRVVEEVRGALYTALAMCVSCPNANARQCSSPPT